VAAFQSPHVTTITYPNACHTLEFEPDRQRFADDLVKWLQDSQ
jgi:alpha-beta hydrolase superfamily lysophospholipase